MTEAIQELADSLEEHASNRADFRDVNDAQRYRVAEQLFLAQAQVNANNAPDDTLAGDRAYTNQLLRKRDSYIHACGQAGIDMKESRQMWWSAVYGGLAPYRRSRNV